MNLQYGGTKRTIEKDRETALAQIDKNNKLDRKRAEAVNTLVDSFLSDKAINDSSSVNVTAVSTERALSINVTIDQETFVANQPGQEQPESKPLTKTAERAKQAANAKTVTKRVERIEPTEEQKAAGQPS
jgi:hypothetical protein